MASLSFSSISYDSFRVRVTGMNTSSGTKGIVWYVNGEEYADWSDYDIAESTASSDRLTVDGLEPGTKYEVKATIYYSDGWDDHVSGTVTTELYEPDFSSTEVVLRSSTTDSLTVRVEGLDRDYSGTWIFEFFLYNEYGDELDSISNSRSGGNSYSNNVTFDGLDPSTEYYIDAKIFYDIGDEQESTWTEKISGTTKAEEEYYEPDFSDTEINVSVDGTDVEITLDGLDPDYEDVWQVRWSVYAGDDWIVDSVTLRSDGYDTRWSFDDLTLNADDDGVQPNTQYTVIAYIFTYPDVVGVGQTVRENTTFTTGGGEDFDESGVKLNLFSSEDGRTITAYVSGLDTSYSRNDRYIVWSLDGDPLDEEMDVDAGDSSSGTVTWTDLSPGKTYTVGAAIWYTNNGEYQSKYLSDDITTNAPDRPAKFSWTYDKTKGEPFNLTAQEWCDLLDNINAVRVYKGYSEFTKGSYTETYYYNYFTYPSSGDIFRYQHYNQALNAITGILGDGYSENEVQSGWPVTADCMNLLVEMINAVE